jgi:chromosome segregation ATPase
MFGKEKIEELQHQLGQLREINERLSAFGAKKAIELEDEIKYLSKQREELGEQLRALATEIATKQQEVIEVNEQVIVQEAGFYEFNSILDSALSYQDRLKTLRTSIKEMNKPNSGAVSGSTNWTVNGSQVQGQKMINEVSKLMLRAYNGEVDDAVRTLKPFKLESAIDRLDKVKASIEKLGKTMAISISSKYHTLRIEELKLVADFLEKQAQEKEDERAKREQLKEEAQAQKEYEAEKNKLTKELAHHENDLKKALDSGNEDLVAAAQAKINEVNGAIEGVDKRAANTRTGYIYVISNVGSFGEGVVKIGLTRRLDPDERIHELSNASVPFVFDKHAAVLVDDAVSIERALHEFFSEHRVNKANARKEFFRVQPREVVEKLQEFAGKEVLEFYENPEALEWRLSIKP